jgi:Flp pilus assembly protein TadG
VHDLRRRREQRGSVLMLVPAAVLVLVILGAIAVDSAVAFLGQRELDNYTASAATTAASAGLDPSAFYTNARVVIDPQRADDIAKALQSQVGSGVHDLHVAVTVEGGRVTVAATGVVDDVFARALPGQHHSWHLRAASTATAHPLPLP